MRHDTGAAATVAATVTTPDRSRPYVPRWVVVFSAFALVCALVLRFLALSPPWLDEAQTVEIARRSLPNLMDALRHDGSPPLYYVLLHGWIALFGTGTFAVRALSGVFAVAALPLIYLVAREYGATPRRAWAATLLLATCPFAIRYATETRMYSLVVLLSLALLLFLRRVWLGAGTRWIVAAAVVVASLLLTQYWMLFVVAAVGAVAVVLTVRGSEPARRVLVTLAVGCLGLLPWLPSFLFQLRHTGAPWGSPPSLADALAAPVDWAGSTPATAAYLLAACYYALLVLSVAAVATSGGILLGRRLRQPAAVLAGVTFATLVIGTLVSELMRSAYASRYSAIVLAPFILAIAWGFEGLPRPWRARAFVAVVALALLTSAWLPAKLRSQSGQVADALAAAKPHDVVVFCPDQLGPAVHRQAPHAGRQVVYPTMGAPSFVDWVDYEKRNDAANPDAFAQRVLAMLGPHDALWFVYSQGYPTFHDDCTRLLIDFGEARGAPSIIVKSHRYADERDRLALYRPHRDDGTPGRRNATAVRADEQSVQRVGDSSAAQARRRLCVVGRERIVVDRGRPAAVRRRTSDRREGGCRQARAVAAALRPDRLEQRHGGEQDPRRPGEPGEQTRGHRPGDRASRRPDGEDRAGGECHRHRLGVRQRQDDCTGRQQREPDRADCGRVVELALDEEHDQHAEGQRGHVGDEQ